MSGKSLYETLQVHPDASPDVIKAAYKSLSTKYHPDRDKSADAARRFAEIQQAFDVLSDPDRRRRYDANPAQGTAASSGSSVVFRLDGTSTFLTLDEHQRRGWKEAASCDLSNRDFSGVSFKDAKLAMAKLDGSRFNGCDFRGADLTDSSAKDCLFDKADFAGVKLMRADFTGSRIRAAKFYSVGPVWISTCTSQADRLTETDNVKERAPTTETEESITVIGQANFSNCDLTGSFFAAQPPNTSQQTHTQSSTFGAAREVAVWTRQYFRGCGIKDCNFSGANLYDSDLRSIDLHGSNFLRANLQRAQMQGCNIGAVDLTSCNLVDTNLTGCIVDDATKFPEGYAVPNGAKNSDELHRRKTAADAESFRKSRNTLLAISTMVVAVVVGFITLIYITTPAPPSFYARPGSGVQTDGAFSAWQIPEGEWVPSPNERFVIVEISSFPRNSDLPSSDLTLKIESAPSNILERRKFVENVDFVVLGNLGRSNDLFSFPSGANEADLAVSVRVHKGRSQLRFSWPKEIEGTCRVSRVSFSVASKSLNSEGRVFVSLD